MSERRMMAKSIIKSDQFLDMPATTQNLYFHILLDADDDGFINAPKSIMRMIGAKDDDMKVLVAKQFVIPFESGVVVIKDWKIHNYIQNDRYKPSTLPERDLLNIQKDKTYTLKNDVSRMDTEWIQNVSIGKDRLGKDRLGKVRLGKASIGKASIGKVRLDKTIEGECEKPHSPKRKTFTKPTIDEIQDYCIERNNNVNAEQFFDYYESNGWKVGKNSMKDWKAAVRTWERSEYRNVKVSKKQQAIDVVNDLMQEFGGANEQSATDSESTIDVTASVQY